MDSAGATAFTTPSDREIVATRVVKAPRRLVFEAWTDPRHLPHWMLGPQGWTMPVCEIDLRPGGAWHFVWRRSDGTEMAMRGVYQEIVPPERLVCTESWGGDWPETLNTLILSEENGKTTIGNVPVCVGAVPFECDAWGVDVACGGSQKALSATPGLALVAVSDRAWEATRTATCPRVSAPRTWCWPSSGASAPPAAPAMRSSSPAARCARYRWKVA